MEVFYFLGVVVRMKVGDLVRYITPEGRYASQCALGIITEQIHYKPVNKDAPSRFTLTVWWVTGIKKAYYPKQLEVVNANR